MELLLTGILFLAALAFSYYSDIRRDKVEKDRFREFVIANKAKDITEYVQAVPNDEKFEIAQEDELIDLDQMTPEELLEIKLKENADNKNQN